MRVEPEAALADLRTLLEDQQSIALVASQIHACASAQWDASGSEREDWNAIFSMWILLGEAYRLEARPPMGSPARPRADLCRVLRWTMHGIWAHVWDVPAVADQAAEWVSEEVEHLHKGLGPSEAVIRSFLAGKVPDGAAGEWLGIRAHHRGGLRHAPTHNEFYPYHVLAPELAWCRQAGQEVGRCSAITTFPDRKGLVISESAERILVMLAEHGW